MPKLSVSELYTDNVALTKEGAESEFITVISPGFSVERTGGARFNMGVDFSIDRTYYKEDSSRNEARENLDANVGVELLEDFLFFDGRASISQSIVSQSGVESGTGETDQSNRTQVFAWTTNPNVRHHFGSWADARVDYVQSNVRTQSDNVSNTVSESIVTTITSGREFSFLRWAVDLSAEKSDFSGLDREDKRKLAQLELQYVDRILFQPVASVGYEKIEDGSLIKPPQGLIWSVGGLLQPGPRTSVRLTHGRRFDDPNTSLDASYKISSRTRLTASVEQVLQTSQSLAVSELGAETTPLDPSSRGFSLTNNTFRQTNYSLALEAERGRNTYRVQARLSERKTDAESDDTKVQSFAGSWGRTFSRHLSGALNASFRKTETTSVGSTRTDKFMTYGANLDYQLGSNWSAIFKYTGTKRTSGDGGADYMENAATFSLEATF